MRTYNPWALETEKIGNLDLSMALRWCSTAPPGATRNRAETVRNQDTPVKPCSGHSYNFNKQLNLFSFFKYNFCFIILFMHMNKRFCEPRNMYVNA
jgi:hypothetical protein